MVKAYITDLAARLYREAESVRMGVTGPSVRAVLQEAAMALAAMALAEAAKCAGARI